MPAQIFKGSPLAPLFALPRRLLDHCVRAQIRSAGLVAIHGHHLYAPALSAAAVALDAGAHTGEFSRALADRFGCLCYALEPVPALFAQLEAGPRLHPSRRALGGEDGEGTLHLSGNPQANSLDPALAAAFGDRGGIAVRLSTLPSFLAEHGLASLDLLKLDIEGAEIAVLARCDDDLLGRLGQITVEFHDFLPELQDRRAIAALRRRLRRCGFLCVVLSRPSGDHSDTLFLQRRRLRLSAGERLHLFLLDHLTLPLRRGLQRASDRLARAGRGA